MTTSESKKKWEEKGEEAEEAEMSKIEEAVVDVFTSRVWDERGRRGRRRGKGTKIEYKFGFSDNRMVVMCTRRSRRDLFDRTTTAATTKTRTRRAEQPAALNSTEKSIRHSKGPNKKHPARFIRHGSSETNSENGSNKNRTMKSSRQ